MAISPETLRLTGELRTAIGDITDTRVRVLAQSWATAWNDLSPLVLDGVNGLLADVEAGKIPTRAQLARNTRLLRALDVAQGELGRLSRVAGLDIAKDITEAATQAAAAQGRLIASQLPPTTGNTAQLAASFDKLNPRQLVAIAQRLSGQVTSLLHPLSQASYQAMTRSLLTGVTLGSNPRETAARMVRGVEGGFTGGLTRALTIARTETLDSSRAAAREAHLANADVLSGWQWGASLDRRCCPSCWSKHGNKYPLETPGPLDHQQGRCARIPLTKSWAELGFNIPEPPSALPDAEATFRAMSKADQLAVMGPARLAALDSGKATWADLAQRKTTTGWRDSYSVRPVKDLLSGTKAAGVPAPLSPPDMGVAGDTTSGPLRRAGGPATGPVTAGLPEGVELRGGQGYGEVRDVYQDDKPIGAVLPDDDGAWYAIDADANRLDGVHETRENATRALAAHVNDPLRIPNYPPTTARDMSLWAQSVDTELAEPDRNALYNYTRQAAGVDYRAMNGRLRSGYRAAESVVDDINRITANMLEVPQDIRVFRGTGLVQFNVDTVDELAARVGEVTSDLGFLSTAVDPGSAYGGEITMIIDLPQGSLGRYLDDLSAYSGEHELLLQRDTQMRILKVVPGHEPDADGSLTESTRVWLKVIGPGDLTPVK